MGENTIDWATVNRKLKIERIKRKIRALIKKFVDGIKSAANWVIKNKEAALVIGPVVVGVVTKASKVYLAHREDAIRERRFYDPRFGRYSMARRRLKPIELRQVDERYAAGESYRSILDDMGLLK